MLKRHKFNEKKLLHKIGKHWCVVSIAVLGLIGGIGMSQQSIHADTTNAPTITATAKPNNTTNTNDTVKTNNDNSVQHGTWDNVNVNYYPNDTMELTGNGTINPDHAPESLPFNQDKNDWNLKITQGKANVTLNNSDGNQFSSFNSHDMPKRTIKRNIRHRINSNDDVKNSKGPFWSHFRSMDLSGLDTSKVNDMSYMFDGDEHLSSLDLSGSFNTKNVPEESQISSNGMANIFEDTNIGKIKLGSNTNLNKANMYFDDLLIDVNGNNVYEELLKGTQKPGDYYFAYRIPTFNLHLIGENLNKNVSQNFEARDLKVPFIHDDNYSSIMSHQLDKYLNIPNGYRESPMDQQDYTIHDSHNENIGEYMNIKLVKDSTVNYQSEIVKDEKLLNQYLRKYDDFASDAVNVQEESLISSYGRIIDEGEINKEYNYHANSYTASQADKDVKQVGSALNAAKSLMSQDDNSGNGSQSGYVPSDYGSSDVSSASSASSDQDSSRASSASEASNIDSGQLSQSTSISYVNVPTDNVDLSSYNNEITSLSNQVASSSNEFNKMDNEIRSLNDEVTHLKLSKNTSRRARHRGRVNKRSAKNYKLPRTNSKYWNRVRNVKAKHGFRIYQVHTRFNRKSRILRTKLIKANQRIGVIRYRKSNKSWIVTGHNLHHYRHYYWIYKGDQKFPNHFKMIK